MTYVIGTVVEYVGDEIAFKRSLKYPGFTWNQPTKRCVGIVVNIHNRSYDNIILYTVRYNIHAPNYSMMRDYYSYYDFEVDPI